MSDRMVLYEQLLELSVLERINGDLDLAALLNECARCILLGAEKRAAVALRRACDARTED